MKNKGFTLVELLAIITILSLIAVLITPFVNNFIKNSEDKSYNVQIKTIKEAATNFSLEYGNFLSSVNNLSSFTIDLKLLKDLAFIDFDIRNPKTNKYFSDDTLITFTKNKGNYKIDVTNYDASIISDTIKYKNHIVIIKSGTASINNVLVFNINGVLINDYNVTVAPGDTILNGYNTNIYTVTVGTDIYQIKKLDK